MSQESHEVQNFQEEVLERSRVVPVVVDFWAEWCAPCKILGPVLERLAARDAGRWVLAKVDTDRNQDIAVEYGIRGIPSVKMFVDGRMETEFTGAMPEYAVDQWLRKSLPDPNRAALAKAASLLAEGKGAEATSTLEEVLANDPGNHHGQVLLARALLDKDRARALELVRHIEADSEYFRTADAIKTVALLESRLETPSAFPDDPVKPAYLDAIRALERGEYGPALDTFIGVIRANRYYDDDGARKACVAIFTLLGDENELVRSRRREFSGALFA